MKIFSIPFIVILIALPPLPTLRAQGNSEVRGQISAMGTLSPIEGARLMLDRLPEDGLPEAAATTSAFGFYRLPNIPPGSYRLRVTHGGFAAHDASVQLTASERRDFNATLTPLPGVRFDVFVQLADVVTGLGLQGAPVTLKRFILPGDEQPAESQSLLTDANGHAAFRGMLQGHYRFEANQDNTLPGWLAHSSIGSPQDKRLLNRPHTANMLLKPVYQDLFLRLTGIHPAFGANQLKDIHVELTGVNPADTNAVLIPSRTGVTDENGRVVFRGLPAIAYIARTRRLGFKPSERLILPNASGEFLPGNGAGNPLDIPVAAQPTHLYVNTQHPYAVTRLFDFLPFDLQGLAGSNADGLARRQSSYNVPALLDDRPYFNILAGRYRVLVNSQPQFGLNGVRPHFRAEEVVDVPPGNPAQGNFSDMDLQLHVVPATVRGRLVASEEIPATAPFGVGDLSRQARSLPKAGIPIEIIEFEDDQLLKPAFRTNTVVTDANGEFLIPLLPARYGLRIASLPDYAAKEVRLRDMGSPGGPENPRTLRWPYFQRWPFLSPTAPLLFQSGHEYKLDIHVQKQVYAIEGLIDPRDGGIPALMASGPNPAVVTLQRASDGEVLQTTGVSQFAFNDFAFRFPNLPPGSYTYSISHPHNTFAYGAGESPTPGVFTFSSYPAPGVLPASDPSESTELRPFFSVSQRVESTPVTGSATLQFRFHRYAGSGSAYNVTTIGVTGSLVLQPDYAGGKLRTAFSAPPVGGFTFWRQIFIEGLWFEGRVEGNTGDHTFDVYFGSNGDHGPLGNVLNALPSAPFEWNIKVVNAANPAEIIPGLTRVELLGPAETVAQHINGEIQLAWQGSQAVNSATHDHWVYSSQQTLLADPAIPRFETRLLMTRGVKFQGTVLNQFSNDPLPGVRVQFLNRFGLTERETLTDDQGQFVFAATFNSSEPKFLRLDAPGFRPVQSRHIASDAIPDGPASSDSTITANIALDPIAPGPEIQEVRFDRQGLFLPGAKLAGGSQERLSLADTPLTLTWRAVARSTPVTATITPVDQANGAFFTPQPSTIEDPVVELWLIDPRGHTNDPLRGQSIPMPPPVAGGNPALLAWLQNISTNNLTNVFHQRATNLFATAIENQFAATNQLRLWNLPPGEFRPIIAAVTRAGAVGLHQPFANPAEPPLLHGIPTPPWFGLASDVLAAMGASAPSSETVESWLPQGRFMPLPTFSVGIQANPQGFLSYDYQCEINWTQGFETPASEWLHLAPGTIGLDFTGSLQFGLRGAETNIYFRTSADLDLDDVPLPKLKKMTPKGFPLSLKPVYSHLNVGASTSKTRSFNLAQPHEFEVEDTIEGSFGAEFRANLKPITSKLPYLGPALLALDETGLLEISGVVNGAVGLKSTNIWRTPFPPSHAAGTSTDTTPHVLRRHFLGGDEKQFDLLLCFRFGAGLNVEAFRGRGSARGRLNLAGNQCLLNIGDTPLPSVALELNPDGDWPLFKRISGNITADLEAKLDLWIASVEKQWQWELWTFDHPFNTEPVFQWVPMNIAVTLHSPASALPAEFNPSGTNRIQNLFARASVSTTPNGRAMIFSDIHPTTGEMQVKFASRNPGGAFTPPLTLATAPGIVAASIAERPGSGLVAAWTALTADHLANPFPPSSIMFSTSSDGVAWSQPALLASLPDLATDLHLLASSGGRLGLAFLHNSDGPESSTSSLSVSSWLDSSWTAPLPLASNAPITGFAAARRDSPADSILVLSLGNGSLLSWLWDFATPPSPMDLPGATTGDLAITAAGGYFLAFERPGGGIALSHFGGQWASLGAPIEDAIALDLSIAAIPPPAGQIILSWIEGGPQPRLRAATTDFSGSVQRGPFDIFSTMDALSQVSMSVDGQSARAQVRSAGASSSWIEVGIPPAGPVLLAPRLLGDSFEFTLSGSDVSNVRIQVSTDLETWSNLPIAIDPVPAQTIRVPLDVNAPSLYYRAIAP